MASTPLEAFLTSVNASDEFKENIDSALTLVTNGVTGVRATRDLIAGVHSLHVLRQNEKRNPQNYTGERERLDWERTKFDRKAEIAHSTFEVFSASFSAAKHVGLLGSKVVAPLVQEALGSPVTAVAAAAILQATGVAGAIAAAAPIIAGSAVFLAAAMAAAAIAKVAAENASKRRAERIEELDRLDASTSSGTATNVAGAGGTGSGSGPPASSHPQAAAAGPTGAGSTTVNQAGIPATNNTMGSTKMINTDPETMRTVSAALKTFSEDIDSAKQALQQAVSSASDNWEDDVYTHTESTVEEILSKIAPGEDCSELASHIDTKASALEEYNS